MVIHPPMLYMGYVGFSVAFAFAIAALLGGRLDATWARWSRPWTTVAWSFLTIGIALGSWWAYYELGWGGWWFWDPVENASFMPWLVGTALHPFARRDRKARHVQELDGAARDRRVLAVAARHVPRALGRAHVGACVRHRSGARRVHPRVPRDRRSAARSRSTRCAPARSAAAAASRRCRASRCCSPTTSCSSSRWRACCSARCIRCSSTRSNLGKISVGPPYFDAVFVPLMAPLVFLMGIGPIASWRQARAARPVDAAALGARRRARHGARCCRSCSAAGRRWSRSACFLALWIVAATVAAIVQRLRGAPQRGLAAKLARQLGRVVRHAARASRHRACSSSASRWSRATRSSRTCALDVGQSVERRRLRRSRSAASTPAAGPNYRGARRHVECAATARCVDTLQSGEAHLRRVAARR